MRAEIVIGMPTEDHQLDQSEAGVVAPAGDRVWSSSRFRLSERVSLAAVTVERGVMLPAACEVAALRTVVVTVMRFRHYCAADAETGHRAGSAAPSSSTSQRAGRCPGRQAGRRPPTRGRAPSFVRVIDVSIDRRRRVVTAPRRKAGPPVV